MSFCVDYEEEETKYLRKLKLLNSFVKRSTFAFSKYILNILNFVIVHCETKEVLYALIECLEDIIA